MLNGTTLWACLFVMVCAILPLSKTPAGQELACQVGVPKFLEMRSEEEIGHADLVKSLKEKSKYQSTKGVIDIQRRYLNFGDETISVTNMSVYGRANIFGIEMVDSEGRTHQTLREFSGQDEPLLDFESIMLASYKIREGKSGDIVAVLLEYTVDNGEIRHRTHVRNETFLELHVFEAGSRVTSSEPIRVGFANRSDYTEDPKESAWYFEAFYGGDAAGASEVGPAVFSEALLQVHDLNDDGYCDLVIWLMSYRSRCIRSEDGDANGPWVMTDQGSLGYVYNPDAKGFKKWEGDIELVFPPIRTWRESIDLTRGQCGGCWLPDEMEVDAGDGHACWTEQPYKQLTRKGIKNGS